MKKIIACSFLLLIGCLVSVSSVQGEKYPSNTTGNSKATISIVDSSIDTVKKPEKSINDKQAGNFPKTGENNNNKSILIGLLIVLIGLWLYEKNIKLKKE